MNDSETQPWPPFKQGLVLIAVGAAMLAVAGSTVWYCRAGIARAYEGPLTVSTDDLRKIQEPGELVTPWISLQAENVVPTDVELIEQNNTRTTETPMAEFQLVQVGDHWLIAAMPPGFEGNTFVGELGDWEWHFLWAEARQILETELASVHGGKFLPYQLHGYIDYGQNQKCLLYFMIGLGVVGAGLFIGGIFLLVTASRTPAEEPRDVARELSRVGA